MASNPNWVNFNYNPWRKHLSDCAIRAISGATGLDYREVCKQLGVSYKNGQGLIRNTGIDLDDIEERFGEYFDIVEDYYDNYNFVPDEFKGSDEDIAMQKFDALNGIGAVSKTTLNDFCKEFAGQGKFLVGLVGNPNAKNPIIKNVNDGHIVYANLDHSAKKPGFVDVFDAGEMLVDSYMRVARREPANSPRHWKFDLKQKRFIV